ncbi:MAG: hypothetical protein STHCBS139747_000866 [Sporothrix thermara]
MTDHSSSAAVISGSSDAINQPTKPAEPTGIAGLLSKPASGDLTVKTDVANGDAAARKSESPVGGFSSNAEKRDNADFPKPVTPVSEANGHIGGSDNTADNNEPAATSAVDAPLPLTEPAPAEASSSAESAAAVADSSSDIPTATAPSVTLAAPTTASATDGESTSLTAGIPSKQQPFESSEPLPLTATNTVAGDKRKADELVDAPAEKADKPVDSPLTALSGTGGASSSLLAEPPAVAPEAEEVGLGSPAKKAKTDTSADADAAAAVSPSAIPPVPLSTPAAPPVSVPAPSPVTVSAENATPSAGAAAAPSLEVNLGPAPSAEDIASASTEASVTSVKKSNSRSKREKKPLPPVGMTARKTRSQGPV